MSRFAASFRDPAGICCLFENKVLRLLESGSVADFERFLQTSTARRFAQQGQLVSTRRLPDSELSALQELPTSPNLSRRSTLGAVFEHERIPFTSYPHEWSPEMLWEAGRLTLELAEAALTEGYCLKDATPSNVLFRGRDPVFVDLLSFETRTPGDPVWRPYGQFVRTFLLPLAAHKYWGLRLADIFLTHRDGLEPQEVYRLCGFFQRFKPPLLSLVSMPTWLRSRARAEGQELFRPRKLADNEKALFILQSLLRQLQRALEAVKPSNQHSLWSDYMTTHSYNEQAFVAKEQFVQAVLSEAKPRRLLDIGANTGHFSALAANLGAEVVAVDLDQACVGGIWRRARDHQLNILPLVIDLSRPSPSLGWRNTEVPSFLERAAGSFDCVLMLALIHHLLVTERVPLNEILNLASELTTSHLIVEFVAPQDRMFQELTRGREHLHSSLTEAEFERTCSERFEILRTLPLPDTNRRLYALKRKGTSA